MSAILRVATYNVHKCRGMDRRTQPERIADVMRATDADAIACQEILEAPAEEIAHELSEYTPYFGEVRKHMGEAYGNAVFSRLPVTAARTYDISYRGRERRG